MRTCVTVCYEELFRINNCISSGTSIIPTPPPPPLSIGIEVAMWFSANYKLHMKMAMCFSVILHIGCSI